MIKKIAIIGKTNTGKSTLFNRLIGYRKAIVLDEAGITRDRNYGEMSWQNKKYELIDTGGLDYISKNEYIQENILEQTKKAILESDLALLMLDFLTGVQQEDIDIARFIKKENKKCLLVINKNDIKKKYHFPGDFYVLGMGDPLIISAEQGKNIGNLLDKIDNILSMGSKKNLYNNEDTGYCDSIKVAIIGKPNVGKSSIMNALLNKNRQIVDDNPGTTRDSIEDFINYNNFKIKLIDTAGLRRKSNVKNKVEYYGNVRTLDTIKEADIALLVLDSSQHISIQDKRLAEKILEEKKAFIVILNKYDLISKNAEISTEELIKISQYDLRFLKDAPIITTIAIGKKKNISKILSIVVDIYSKYNKEIKTPELNNFLQVIVNKKQPKIINNRRLHFYYITQVKVKPPSFRVFVNDVNLLYESYKRYLENQFIKHFKLEGIPIVIYYKKR